MFRTEQLIIRITNNLSYVIFLKKCVAVINVTAVQNLRLLQTPWGLVKRKAKN